MAHHLHVLHSHTVFKTSMQAYEKQCKWTNHFLTGQIKGFQYLTEAVCNIEQRGINLIYINEELLPGTCKCYSYHCSLRIQHNVNVFQFHGR
jgi:hypothetical protein